MQKKECVAMLLAGGQGSRLYSLTKKVAKPAVPFGGKYKIIDFPLSNCVNSGIDAVGVLTQYEPHELHSYIGNGQPWDLDRLNGGVYILPPYQRGKDAKWYRGTANAIYQNASFVESFCPEYVLILSGDHIYQMDYSKMINFHKQKNADCTIAVLNVPIEEASRFGIMTADKNGAIVAFEEKPEHPKSTLASMGIYVFNWKKLKEYLKRDDEDPGSQNDFGKNIIPTMLAAGERMAAYPFDGYWKDVGTIESLWEANMDLLSNPTITLDEDKTRIYARTVDSPPHYISDSASVKGSIVTQGCRIEGAVENSVLFTDVYVGENASVKYSVLMPGAQVCAGAHVEYAIIAENAVVGENAIIGGKCADSANDAKKRKKPQGITVVASEVTIGAGAAVREGQMIDSDIPGAEGRE